MNDTETFTGRVYDSGGGRVVIDCDRDMVSYPPIDSAVDVRVMPVTADTPTRRDEGADATGMTDAFETRVVNSATGGAKGSKLARYDLIPAAPLQALAEHFGAGADKYAHRNWERGIDYSLSYAAMMRHAVAWWGGEDDDTEMGDSHLVAVAWHAFALLELMVTHPELDDRPTSPPRNVQSATDTNGDGRPDWLSEVDVGVRNRELSGWYNIYDNKEAGLPHISRKSADRFRSGSGRIGVYQPSTDTFEKRS